eukprot:scaffold141685_cov139-Phaeocystis_antarctica.AAC.1
MASLRQQMGSTYGGMGAERTWTIVDPHASCTVVGVAEVRIDLPDGGEQIDPGDAAARREPALEFRIASPVCVQQRLDRHVPWNGPRALQVIVAACDDLGACCDVHVAWCTYRTVIRRASAGLAEKGRRIPG